MQKERQLGQKFRKITEFSQKLVEKDLVFELSKSGESDSSGGIKFIGRVL